MLRLKHPGQPEFRMLFTEPSFLFVFLPLLLALYFASPERFRNLLLTAASIVFFAVGERSFLPWLVASIGLNYFIAVGLATWRGTPRARPLLIVGIISDLLLLLAFKYADFFCYNLNRILAWLGQSTLALPHIALPLGISFFTFHKISYKIDVYRGDAEARRNPLDLALYILLFPQLIAGPIVRYHDIAGELVRRTVTASDFGIGIRRFIVGFGKKQLIANIAALCADNIFALPTHQLATDLAWLGVACYTIQIYFDFSGYSDMAIGLARMFGFHFPENFNFPYISTSITDFWRRWHMSLSRWFRDYLYIPLGGNRSAPSRTYLNLLLVFFLCGLWHGASWNFVIWGLFHGGFLILERLGRGQWLLLVPKPLRHFYTLLVVMIGWVFFRADNLGHALSYLGAMFGRAQPTSNLHPLAMFLTPERLLALLAAVIGSTPLLPRLGRHLEHMQPSLPSALRASVDVLRVAALCALFVLAVSQVAAGTYNPFIYFRF